METVTAPHLLDQEVSVQAHSVDQGESIHR
jgi:hypothetical protein